MNDHELLRESSIYLYKELILFMKAFCLGPFLYFPHNLSGCWHHSASTTTYRTGAWTSTISAVQGPIAECVSLVRMGPRVPCLPAGRFDRCDFLLPFCSHKKGEEMDLFAKAYPPTPQIPIFILVRTWIPHHAVKISINYSLLYLWHRSNHLDERGKPKTAQSRPIK